MDNVGGFKFEAQQVVDDVEKSRMIPASTAHMIATVDRGNQAKIRMVSEPCP